MVRVRMSSLCRSVSPSFRLSENQDTQSRPKAIWDNDVVDILCDVCIVEIEVGHRPGTSFTKIGWENMVKNISEKTQRGYDKAQLKNKLELLKGEWKLWKQLIGKETGLGWNGNNNTVDASEEWWRSKIKVCIENQINLQT